MKIFYSAESAHGSSTSHGFCNDTVVKCFSSKKARNIYVNESDNISCKAILKSEATSHAANANNHCGNNAPTPFTEGHYWAIVKPMYLNSDLEIDGCLGVLDNAIYYDDDSIVERFYK